MMNNIYSANRDKLYWLASDEAANPYHYISLHFNGTQLSEIRENLWEWVMAALSEGWIWNKHSPRYLLAIFEECNKLIECAHVLRGGGKDPTSDSLEYYAPFADTTSEHIISVILNPDETSNPMLVVEDFCRQNSLQNCRERLWGWLCAAFGTSHLAEYRDARMELLFYRQLERLHAGLYLLNKKNWECYTSKSNSSLG